MYLTQSTMTIIIAAISAIAAILVYKRYKDKDTKEEMKETYSTQTRTSMQLDTISTSINNIALDVKDLKTDIKTQDSKINEVSILVTRVEESTKSAHKRIDDMESIKSREHIDKEGV